jgi:hypothetical protein
MYRAHDLYLGRGPFGVLRPATIIKKTNKQTYQDRDSDPVDGFDYNP